MFVTRTEAVRLDDGYNFRIQDFRCTYMYTGSGSGDTHACTKGGDRVGLGVRV